MNATLSGCQAMHGCEKKNECLRYQVYRDSNGYQGWSAYQQCKISEFTEKKHLFFFEKNKDEK